MKTRKIPIRSCVVTKERCEKKDLIRVVRTPEGNVVIDESGKVNGRGAYLKREIQVINKAKSSKILERHLETTVPDSVYEELISIIK